MAIEDAAVLTRCLLGCDDGDPAGAYGIYARTRRDRTARVQILSGRNTWLRGPEETGLALFPRRLENPAFGLTRFSGKPHD